MKKLLTLLFTSGALMGVAQKAPKPDAYAKTITAADLKKHLYILAAPEMEGRETGTEGQRKAAAYIEEQFKVIGLQPGNGDSYQQVYYLYQDSLTHTAVDVNGTAYEMDKDFAASPAATQATYRLSEVVIINGGAKDSLATMDLMGKAVMVVGAANNAFFRDLARRSPAAVLTVSTAFPRTTPSARKGRQGIHGFSKAVSAMQFQVSEAVAKAIAGDAFDAVKAGGGVRLVNADVMLEVKKASNNLPASNVIAVLPGTDLKDEYVVVSAHYDHVGRIRGVIHPGADDDGSGTVGIMELAEAFAKASKEGKGPRRSIVFLANSGEEKGLLGSEWYTDHPLYPLEKTTVNLNIDMIGRSDPDRKGDTLNYVYVVGDDKLSSELKPISEGQNAKYTKLQLDYKYNDPNDPNRIYYRSDHYNFARKGVPIIFYYDGMLRPDYHKPTDTPDKVNYDLLQKRAQLVFYTAWEMANRDAMLKRDIPLNTPPRTQASF